ncbi:bacterial translation initiation factor 2 (bIF-2) [Bacteroidales bacterium WCE2004]|nr:bacterial translation initiation factor 2 (bIF-2) [Bacteroidales bacterium WCE2004]
MADIRISKLLRQFNIGLADLVDFLQKQGVEVEANPNAKVSDEFLPVLNKQFGKDLELKQAADKVEVKITEILEKSGHRSAREQAEEEEEPEQETIIKSNTFINAKKETPQPEETPVPQPEPQPEPAVEPEEPAAPQAPAAEPEPEVPEVEPEAPEAEPEAPAVEPEPEIAEPEPEVAPEEPVAAPEPAARPEPKAQEEAGASPALKVVGKIDLSQFDRKPKKRERISKGTQKVDVAKAGANIEKNPKKDNNRQQQNQQNQQAGKGRKRDRDRFKPQLTEAQQEELQKEIQKQVKETYAKMNEGKKNNFGAKYRKEKREAAAQRTQEEMAEAMAEQKVLKVTEFVTVNDLATLMNNTPVVKVIGACMSLGLMVSINQRLDAETLVLVAEEFGYQVEFVTAEISEEISSNEEADKPEDLQPRPPIITVMGHVDHGKTSLLDYIRKSNVIAGEAGGITQHIGAYNVKLPDGRRITFLDTPGHEAFTAMRARGAQLTDLAIIIVAADDAVMPQTIEAINHAQAANVPMVFAINKIDKPGANPDTIRRQLSEMNILVEDWGGKYQCQEISAKQGINVDKLLEKVLLETDLLELKANPNKKAVGAVIESSLDKGRGYLATVLVQEGTLRPGDVVLCGSYYGRVKSMFNERGQKITEAGPSTPVSVLGLNGAPAAGEKFNVMADEREAKNIATKREQLLRIQGIKTQKHMTLEEIGRRIAIGNFKELNIIVKGDVDGSVEALSDSLIKLSTEEVKVNVIHKAVGGISESDVLLAEASDAVIVGFQVRPTPEARKAADREGIEIRLYSVIYDCINEVKDGIEGMLEPEKKEEVIATAEVKQTFRISKVGTIAGCIMRDGKMVQKSKVRLIRDGIVIYTGELGSLQIGKDTVKEVVSGKECGMSIAGYNDIKEGDMIEGFQIVEIKRTL